jgi:fumarylpyruvate hydrolase
LGYVVPPPAVISLPIRGSEDRFPVRRIYCVGRNYAAHAVEMGHDPDREPPFFFQKNPDNLVQDGRFPYPPRSSDLHHEIELVVALEKGGRDIPPEHAQAHVFGYAVGIDMTRRDLQAEAKAMGRPWEVGKAFEHSALCGELLPARIIG